ncbi:hypothetical protein [Saccharothrix lopnurensis]|uniref:AAA ATPase-like protein n=1 Tax=Saccharothrix lopnurensis TaxID=1670621 RepID=A0ABW1P0Y4_9PSEU
MSEEGHRPDDNRPELVGSAHDVVQARDVTGGVHLYGHVSRFPGPPPRRLPGNAPRFVNRVDEPDQLDATSAEDGNGVVIVVGTAGVGKTSLAVRWAHRIKDRFPDGQLHVNLRGCDPAEPVTPEQALDRFLHAVRAVFAWSYRALPDEASGLFRVLGPHPGPRRPP